MSSSPSPTSPVSSRHPSSTRRRLIVVALLVGLWLLRVPSLAQPMASDQSLYAYAGQRLLAGDAPYAGAWDQKPPGVHVVYAILWALWPHESVGPAADLVVAALVAGLVVLIGRRRFTEDIGVGAAGVFLLFGNPSLSQSLSGAYVRGQCETFIALTTAAAIALAASTTRTRRHLVGIGVLLGCGFWLKYNAAAYALVVLIVLRTWPRDGTWAWPTFLREVGWIAGAGALTVAIPLAAMAWAGVLTDLELATITYNLAYAGDSFKGSVLGYAVTFPIDRARNDTLWLLGGIGALGALLSVALRTGTRKTQWVETAAALGWVAAACLSILINGARDLPQYFVQAAPALALLAAVGLAPWLSDWRTRPVVPALVLACVLFAISRPGDRGHVPAFVENVTSDWSALRGHGDRRTYLARFSGRKWIATEIDDLAAEVVQTTAPTDTIYVFGFSPGVLVQSGRRSASRFHWSRPVVIEFAADTPGYGSTALLTDLRREAPALVALQKQDWGPGEPNSVEFFHTNPGLQAWLSAGYALERTTPLFEIWRRQ